MVVAQASTTTPDTGGAVVRVRVRVRARVRVRVRVTVRLGSSRTERTYLAGMHRD